MKLADEAALDRLLKTTRCRVAGTPVKPPAAPAKGKGRVAQRSALEAELRRQIEASDLPQPDGYDVPYLVGSRCRADILYREQRLIVEIQGGVHLVRTKARADIRKAAESLLQGYRLLPVDKDAIECGQALAWIRRLLAA